MKDFLNRSSAEEYFSQLLPDLKKQKIKAVFTLSSPNWFKCNAHRTYFTDESLYIMLENEMCLVIDFLFIDELHVEYRKLTSTEISYYNESPIYDYFNDTSDIYTDILNLLFLIPNPSIWNTAALKKYHFLL